MHHGSLRHRTFASHHPFKNQITAEAAVAEADDKFTNPELSHPHTARVSEAYRAGTSLCTHRYPHGLQRKLGLD